jgi:hypothetical protein
VRRVIRKDVEICLYYQQNFFQNQEKKDLFDESGMEVIEVKGRIITKK